METLLKISKRLVNAVDTTIHRYLYDEINWDDRLVMIKGARGVGKTTMMLQKIKEKYGADPSEALYASCDNIWFSDNKIFSLAEKHYENGGKHLFLDEIHLYSGNWQKELKNIYDSFPDYKVVVTGSSIIHLDNALADLSRRCLDYRLYGLSFREYLHFKGVGLFSRFSLEQILRDGHTAERHIVENLPSGCDVLTLFKEYIGMGYYPFFLNNSKGEYQGRIEKMVDVSIMRDFPAVAKIEYETLYKIKRLLYVMSQEFPFQLNVNSLSQKIEVSRNSVIHIFDLLDKGAILRCLDRGWRSPKSVAKPSKILFDNVDIMAALTPSNESGTIRETFMASMVCVNHRIFEPPVGDLLVDETYLFEIGGKSKKFTQIADLPNSFVVVDNEEFGFGNRYPLWIFGFLY